MNVHPDELLELPSDPKKLEAYIAERCRENTALLFKMREKTAAGMARQFEDVAATIGQAYSKLNESILMRLAIACQAEQTAEAKIRDYIEARLHQAEGALGICQAKLNKANRKLQARAEKAAMRESGSPSIPTTSQQPNGTPSLPSSPAPSIAAMPQGSQSDRPASHFPVAPTQAELAGLVVPFDDQGNGIALDQLPPAFWVQSADQPFFFTLEPTPLSRVQLSAYRVAADQIAPAGTVFVNITVPMALETLQTFLQTLGIPQGAYLALDLPEAWEANSVAFGPHVTGAAWDRFNIPHPAVSPQVPPLNLVKPEIVAELAAEMAPEPNGEQFVQFGDVGERLGELAGRLARPAQLPPLPAVPPIAAGPLGLPGLPTFADLCRMLDPLYAAVGVPAELRFPCKTLAEVEQHVMTRLFHFGG